MNYKKLTKLTSAILAMSLIPGLTVGAADINTALSVNNSAAKPAAETSETGKSGKLVFPIIKTLNNGDEITLSGEFDNYYDWQVLKLTNKQRLANGLEPLSEHDPLFEAAYERSYELVSNFDHTRPDGSDCSTILEDYAISWSSMGENIAAGYSSSAAVVDAWMNSEGHRANILTEEFTHLGVGVYQDSSSYYGTYWTQLFVDAQCVPEISGLYTDLSDGAGYYQTGTSIDDMSLVLGATCAEHGECYVPIAQEMCDAFNINETGVQKLVINYKDQAADVNIAMHPFKDVGHAWYTENVVLSYLNGYMTGLNETTFGPGSTLLRAQFATILYRMAGSPEIEYSDIFADVPDGQWYTDAILWAYENGIVTGYESEDPNAPKTFGPGDNINREQMAAIFYRYAQYKGYDLSAGQDVDLNSFSDADKVSDWAVDAVKWNVGAGIITGKDDGVRLDPKGNANRAECATIIIRFDETYETTE